MAILGDVLGAVISQIGKGRSQADMATLEVARAYQDHPLLKEFPIPRLTLDEVVIDLKMSISATPAYEKFITPEVKSQILSRMEELMKNLPDVEPSFIALIEKSPPLREVWASVQSQAVKRLSTFLPAEVVIEPKPIAEGAASIIRGYLVDTVMARAARIRVTTARAFLGRDVPQIEAKLNTQIQDIIVQVLKSQPIAPDRIDVLVTASDLQGIPPEKITTMKLTLRESDRTWTRFETEEGETVEKLVPN